MRALSGVMAGAALLLAACGGAASGAGTTAAPSALSGGYSLGPCHPLKAPATPESTVEWLNQGAQSGFDVNLVGADVAASAQLPGSRFVFVFGDTTRDNGGGVHTAVRNSISLAADSCTYTVVAPGAGAAVPDRKDGVGYWPMSVLVGAPESGITRFTVMMQRVQTTGAAEFANLGPAVAVFAIGASGAPQLESVTDVGPDEKSRTRPCWGAASYAGTDGYWYVYGTSSPGTPGVFGWAVQAARVPAGKASELGKWEYWDGKAWGASESAAAELIPAQDGVSQTFSVFSFEKRMYMLSKKGGFLGSDLAVWPMGSATGPVSEPVTVGLLPNTTNPEVLLYMPLAQPELPTGVRGKMIVSVSRNSTDQKLLESSPTLYRPFFLEVTLPPKASTKDLTPPPVSPGTPSPT